MKPLPPIDKFEMNRMIHARAQELSLPGSPAGKNAHKQLSHIARTIYGASSWSELSLEQMRAVYDYLDHHSKLPSKV